MFDALERVKSFEPIAAEGAEKKAPTSCTIGPGPQIKRVWFDMYGNSPVISHYLYVYGFGKTERRTLKIHRSEVIREEKGLAPRPTYRHLILESLHNSRRIQKMHRTTQEEIQRERNKLVQNLNEEIGKERKRAWRVLSRPQLVKTHADQIVEMMNDTAMQQKSHHSARGSDASRRGLPSLRTGRLLKD
ncbi:hypothetical protein HDV00_004565 [Rhizophlyctis rosea]|nr:hypothetical protein HDV00_004565 [Rhizophlyctis rosea]